jgi:hypothetical protein
VLALLSAPLGMWAVIAPRSFYDDFPGLGRRWISPDGPFNEHLVRDFGGLNLALAVFTVCAAIWLLRPMVVAAALAWIVWPLPHLAYHSLNLHHYDDTVDKLGVIGGLLFGPVIAVGLLLAARSLQPRT